MSSGITEAAGPPSFHGRWDDPHGGFRTLYRGESLLGCLLEAPAFARKDKHLAETLEEIEEDLDDAQHHPTATSGTLDVVGHEVLGAGASMR